MGTALDVAGVGLAGGDDGLLQTYRLTDIGRPVVGVEHRVGGVVADRGEEGNQGAPRCQVG